MKYSEMLEINFCNDHEKIVAFIELSKKDFLKVYPDVTEKQYDATRMYILMMLHYVFHVLKADPKHFA